MLSDKKDYFSKKNVVYLLGSKYTPLKKNIIIPKNKIRDEIQTIMVTFGG